jgi:hypothetical protein
MLFIELLRERWSPWIKDNKNHLRISLDFFVKF